MKHTKNIAVIDIGSNTLRLLIGNFKKNKLNKIYTDRVITRLGQNLTKNFILSEESIKNSIDALIKFKKDLEKYDVFCIIAFGTSALREAKNSKDFCEQVEKLTGIKIRIFTEKEEAYYTFLGVTGKENKNIFILDIGGGSTEWIYHNDELIMDSIPIGVLKIKELFLNEDPLSEEKLRNTKEFIVKELKKRIPSLKIKKIIATGGTASTLAMIYCGINYYCPEKTHNIEISLDKLKSILKELSRIPISERKKIVGLPSDRADIICSGLVILETFLDYLNADILVISETGIIEGVMKNYKSFCYNKNL